MKLKTFSYFFHINDMMNVYSTEDYMAYELYYNYKEFDFVIDIDGFVRYKTTFIKYYSMLRKIKLKKIMENN